MKHAQDKPASAQGKRKRKLYAFFAALAVLLVAIAALAGLALARMEGYITSAGKQNIAAITEQMRQSYDLQISRIYERLGWVESNFLRTNDRSVNLSDERDHLLNAMETVQYELLFMRENGQVMMLDGQTVYLDMQASSLLRLREGGRIAQTVSWDTGSGRQSQFLAAIPCEPYTVDGTRFSALGVLLDRSIIDEMLSVSGYGGAAKLFAIDERGTVLYTNQEGERYFRNYDLLKHLRADGIIAEDAYTDLVSQFSAGETGALYVDGIDAPFYIGYQPLTTSTGEFVIAVSASVLNSALIEYQRLAMQMIFVVAVALALLCAGLIYSFSRIATAEQRARFEEETRRIKEEAMVALEFERDRANHANQAKSTFLSNMSHDIRTPMNAIVGFTSLAMAHLDDKALLKDYLSKISTSSEHLVSLINDILDMSRIESGKVKIDEAECSLPALAHDLRSILLPSVNAKRLDFFIDTVDIEHENVICDKLRVNQVLINIAGNAIKFTPAGGAVSIRFVELPGAPQGHADFAFTVKDTGIGMSAEFLETIFEPFTRERTSTVSRAEGTGLGMAITKNIVDMMGGTIDVASTPGAGSLFTVRLRFKTGAPVAHDRVIPQLKNFRALVADDNMDTCGSVAKMLRAIGMRPEWTTSGKEVVYRARMAYDEHDPFHVYIIDWLMPDMNGVEVTRRVRAEVGDDVPIVILTAYDWADIEEEARRAGVTAFCSKPLFLSDLYDALRATQSDPGDAGEKLPAGRVKTADEKDAAALSPDGCFQGRRVLLVEDVELNREIVEAVLDEAGILHENAENGQLAVEMVEAAQPGYYDLVLMDVMMPVMDGYAATRAIRSLPDPVRAHVPIVAMTANAFEEDRQLALEAGMDAHLAKPFQIEALYDVMRRFL